MSGWVRAVRFPARSGRRFSRVGAFEVPGEAEFVGELDRAGGERVVGEPERAGVVERSVMTG